MNARSGSNGHPAEAPGLHGIGAPALAQVNLLPPEVYSRRALGRTKLRLGIGLLAVVLVSSLAFVYATFAERQAASELARVQDEITVRQAEMARYAEVPLVKSQIEMVQQARLQVTAPEILWGDQLRALQAVLPPDATMVQYTADTPDPVAPAAVLSSNALDGASVATIGLVFRSRTLPVVADLMNAVDSLPGYADSWFTSAELTDEAGVVFYQVSGSVRLEASPVIFPNRYAQVEAEEE